MAGAVTYTVTRRDSRQFATGGGSVSFTASVGPRGADGPNEITTDTATDFAPTAGFVSTGTSVVPLAFGAGLMLVTNLPFTEGALVNSDRGSTAVEELLAGDATFGGSVTASAFVGDGSGLTGIPGGGGMAVGDTVTGGTAGRVLFVGAGPVLADDSGVTYDLTTNVVTVGGVWLADAVGVRRGTLAYNDAGGQHRLGRTDHSSFLYIQPNETFGVISGSGIDVVLSTSSKQVVICGREDGGTSTVDLNRRYSDSSSGVGGTVRCWTKTSQTANALEVLAPGGGSAVMAVDATGAIELANLADSAAPNNSLYYSTTAGKAVYKDGGGTVNALY